MKKREGNGPETEPTKHTEKAEKHHQPHGEDKAREAEKDQVIAALRKEVEGKDSDIKDLQQKILYSQADFENFKKLKIKEKLETLKFGNEALLQELIPVLDSLEMALEHASRTEDAKALVEGVRLTFNQFLKVLEKSSVERIDALGKKFDPNLHEAVYQEERDDTEPDMVVSEVQKGYLLNGRLVRAARVAVSKRPDSE